MLQIVCDQCKKQRLLAGSGNNNPLSDIVCLAVKHIHTVPLSLQYIDFLYSAKRLIAKNNVF